jgi:hypothetical protein
MHAVPLVVNAGVALSPRRLRVFPYSSRRSPHGSPLRPRGVPSRPPRCCPLPRAAVPSRAGWGRGVVDAGGGRGRGRGRVAVVVDIEVVWVVEVVVVNMVGGLTWWWSTWHGRRGGWSSTWW